MTDQTKPAAPGRDLAVLRADIDRLRRDLADLADTLRLTAAHEWDRVGTRLRTAASARGNRLLTTISKPSDRLTGIAFCVGVAAGLFLRARSNSLSQSRRSTEG